VDRSSTHYNIRCLRRDLPWDIRDRERISEIAAIAQIG
jgi:hypothetical protein